MQRNYTVGERCDKCGTPTIQGAKGAYCKPCYIAYKNGQSLAQGAGQPQAKPVRLPEDQTTVAGKCKTLFLLEAFKMQMPLAKAEPLAEEWAKAAMRILPKTTAQSFNVEGMMREDIPAPEGHYAPNEPVIPF